MKYKQADPTLGSYHPAIITFDDSVERQKARRERRVNRKLLEKMNKGKV